MFALKATSVSIAYIKVIPPVKPSFTVRRTRAIHSTIYPFSTLFYTEIMLLAPAVLLLVSLLQPIYSDYGQEVNLKDKFFFTPVDSIWQKSRCNKLQLEFKSKIEKRWGKTGVRLNTPKETLPITGDGNCFFRAISTCVTGSDDDYMKIRTAVVTYMELFMPGYESESHMKEMEKSGTWAEEMEMFATARVLETPVFVYSPKYSEWVQYSPKENSFSVEWTEQPSIYLKNTGDNHFEVVTSMYK